jgi:hypothetical protein
MTISQSAFPRSVSPLIHLRHLLPTKHVLNQAIREDIYRLYIQVTWTSPLTSLGSKMSFYLENFLELQDGIVVPPLYMQALDALTQDPFGSTPGWISSTPWIETTTIYHGLIGSARCAIYRSRRQRCTSSLGAPYTMRSEDATIAYIGTQGAHSLLSSDTRTKDA